MKPETEEKYKPGVPMRTVEGYDAVIIGCTYNERLNRYMQILKRLDTLEYFEFPGSELHRLFAETNIETPAGPKVPAQIGLSL